MTYPTLPPQAPPPRRTRPAWVLPAMLGSLLLAGLLAAAVLVAGPRGDDTIAVEDASLGALLDPAVAFAGEDQPGDAGQAGQAPGDRPLRHGRFGHGPLRLAEGEKVVAGSVVSAGDGKLVVRKDNGAEATVPTDAKTKVRGAKHRSLSDLKAGDRVVIKVGTDGVAGGVLVVRAHAAGTVTRLDGDHATVVRAGGLRVELDLSGVSERPEVGTVVVAVGTATDGGATLKVEQLRELPTLG
jgi:hypothetical protein